MQNSYRIVCSDELTHHGINGQRWGHRNGPPYPLDYESHSRKEKAENSKSEIGGTKTASESSSSSEKSHERKHLTEQQKKYIKIGAGVVAGIAIVSGGIYISKNLNSNNMKLGKGIIDDIIKGNNSLGFKTIVGDKTILENAAAVNPNRVIDPYDKAYAYTNNNCGNCATAFECRMRNLDVQARGNAHGMTYNGFKRMFSGYSKTSEIVIRELGEKSGSEVLTDMLKKQYSGKDARGAVLVPMGSNGTHWVNWIKKGDQIVYIDSQSITRDAVKECLDKYVYDASNGDVMRSIRLDDLKINNKIKNAIVDYVGERDMTSDVYDMHWLDGESAFMKNLIKQAIENETKDKK